jgi:Cyanobacterial TRADD-N associated 2-Transmembrane domain
MNHPAKDILTSFSSAVQEISKKKKDYENKLNSSNTKAGVYKYLLLNNLATLEGYEAQSRLQAQQSFNLSKLTSIVGFVIIAIAICISIILTICGQDNLNVAYLTGIAGILTEFTSGISSNIFAKTLGQINTFADKLVEIQKTALEYIDKKKGESMPVEPDKM